MVQDVETEELYDKANTSEDRGEGDEDCRATSQLIETNTNDGLMNPEKECVQPGGLKVIIIASIIFALAVTVALIVDIYTGEHYHHHGVVSSDAAECSVVGEKILKKGGSAVDAAIATSICVGVVCPESSGIGGGGFMLVQSSEGERKVIDFREYAPAAAEMGLFTKDKKSSRTGGLSVAVPSQVQGLEKAHKMFGKLPWKELFTPAIDIARRGFTRLNSTDRWLSNDNISLGLSKEFKNILHKDKTVKRPNLANTLEIIAEKGSEGFLSGDIAKSIVNTVVNAGGVLTLNDLRNYTVEVRDALSTDYQDYHVFTAGPPTSGLVLLSALNILEGFNLSQANRSDPLVYHLIVETLKFVYAQRTRLADPKFISLDNLTRAMLSKQEASKLRERINLSKTYNDSKHYGPFFEAPPNNGTSHVSVIDGKGGIVSVTSTINGPFGSKLYTPTGILLNNEMDDFSIPGVSNFFDIEPSKANYLKPKKRPLSSICPVIAMHKNNARGRQVVLGASGGSRITSAVIQVLFNILTFDQSLSEAIEWPRLHHQLLPMYVEAEGEKFEKEVPKTDILKYLREKGNLVVSPPHLRAIVNGASKYDKRLYGHADSRRGTGAAAVF